MDGISHKQLNGIWIRIILIIFFTNQSRFLRANNQNESPSPKAIRFYHQCLAFSITRLIIIVITPLRVDMRYRERRETVK